MKKKHELKQIIVQFVCIFFILFLLSSLSFIIFHADHNCTGKDCSICMNIQSTNNLIKQLGVGIAQIQNIALIIVVSCITLLIRCFYRQSSSLVKLKVRLNI